MAVQCYPIPAHRPVRPGDFEERWRSPVNAPVFGPAGEIAYLIHRLEDVSLLEVMVCIALDARARAAFAP